MEYQVCERLSDGSRKRYRVVRRFDVAKADIIRNAGKSREIREFEIWQNGVEFLCLIRINKDSISARFMYPYNQENPKESAETDWRQYSRPRLKNQNVHPRRGDLSKWILKEATPKK